MEPSMRFLAYAAAFEATYIDDDWARLEPYFTDDAVYAVTGGPPLGGRFEGRDAILDQLRFVLDALDRRFDRRRLEPVGKPTVGESSFELSWRATYEKLGCPDLVIGGVERASFEADRIVLLEDILDEGTDGAIQRHLDEHLGPPPR